MPKGLIKLDVNCILNMVKNDRHFETIKGAPRDSYVTAAVFDNETKILTLTIESSAIEGKSGGLIDIELYGNADAMDENGELKALIPAPVIAAKIL